MSLKTIVKVGNISNLSDARYCSGMGVEMLGFNVIEGKDNFINEKTYQEIRGWVSGPLVVAEVYGLKSAADLQLILENYMPDFLELSVDEISIIEAISTVPLMLAISECIMKENEVKINSIKSRIAFFIIRSSNSTIEFIQNLSHQFPLLIAIEDQADVVDLIERLNSKGISLHGGTELKPGLKDYDHLATILEQLEID